MTCGVSEVAEFYNGKSVFISGGTGFLGKVLIEKLLHSCKQVNKIYVLVRAKKGMKAEHRISEITENEGFTRIKKRNPDDLLKIVPVIGSLEEDNLGLSRDDLDTLIKNVSVVFHVAATIRFDEPLEKAVQINVNGTEKTLKVCHLMENLQAFVHVSTMYSNTDRREVLEQVYPAPDALDHVRYMAERYSDRPDIINILLGKRPNTYTYTKAVTEELVNQQHGDIPTVIVRPSIVTASHSEPFPGWIDNWNGPTRFVAGIAAGVMRVLYGKPEGIGDFIPVDFVTNFMIVAATKCEKSNDVKVYNCCSGNTNPITWQKQVDLVLAATKKHQLNEVPLPFAFYTKYNLIYQILAFFLHILPAWCSDTWSQITGGKPKNMMLQDKVQKTMNALAYFTHGEWLFRDTNLRKVWTSLNTTDRDLFNFDVKTINWKEYLSDYVLGIRKFMIKPKMMDTKKNL